MRIPGSSILSSTRATAVWGADPPGTDPGIPSGDDLIDYWNFWGVPAYFAVSDRGAGYLPWGFWQVVLYPSGQAPAYPFPNPAYQYLEVSAGEPPEAVANVIFGALSFLRAYGATLPGNERTAEFIISQLLGPSDPVGAPTTIVIKAPFGCIYLDAFYEGPTYSEENETHPRVKDSPGQDNPLLMALWGPGQRAILRAVAPIPPSPYYGDPYPPEPPHPVQ
jgi:hypothetical protein